MPALHSADQDLLHKLLLGQLSTAEVERLATEYADDGRLAELAESLAGKGDALLWTCPRFACAQRSAYCDA